MFDFKNENFFDAVKNISDNSIDLILTDPPYGISHKDGWINSSKKTKALAPSIMNDKPDDLDWDVIFKEFYRILKPNKMCYFFGRTDVFLRLAQNIKNSDLKYCHDFVWRKGDMNYGNLGIMGNIHEMCIGLSKGSPEKSRPLIIDGEEKKRYKAEYNGKVSNKEYYGHPTQKPIGLLSYIIAGRTDVNDVVFDPFAGVGSTSIACEINNRNSISFELDDKFYELALKRLNDKEHLEICRKQIETGLSYGKSGLLSYGKFE